MSGTASAQARYSRNYSRNYYGDGYVYDNYDRPTVYDRHRKAVNIGVATGIGAIVGYDAYDALLR